MAKNARMAAFNVLYKIECEKAYLNIALKEELSSGEISDKDARLASALVYGCVRYKLKLDYIISKFSSVKLKKLSDKIIICLRLGIYQLLFMDKIPESAAVNESVKICTKLAFKSKGFVNGILRSIVREKENIKYPDDLSFIYSYPRELTEYFKAEFENYEEILKNLNCEKDITIRVNTEKTTAYELKNMLEERGIKAKSTPLSNALAIGGVDISNLDLYKEGFFSVQGLSSIMAVDVMDIKKGECIFDMCAAPGGKSCYIAEKTGKNGNVHSFDVHPHKCELILKNALRLGLCNIKADVRDSSVFDKELSGKADRVLCDVPCAGLGIISKKPDIKYSYTKQGHDELAELQLKILKACSKYVKKGGVLVYSTCSMGRKENISNIEEFLKCGSFETVSIKEYIPDCIDQKTAELGYINVMPENNFDGFFICKMKRI